jgi:hypothetical protein
MAAVVVTSTINYKGVFGAKKVAAATLAFDTGDYAAGGIAVTPAHFGMSHITAVTFQGACVDVAATPTALIPRFVASSSKIQLFEAATAGASFTEKPAEAMGAGATVAVFVIGH